MHPKNKRNEKGFVVPISMILMILLAVSGMNFLQLDFLEQRMMRKELDNHSAFYLANAGIERARESFKLPAAQTWTALLRDPNQRDNAPDPRLCPDPARGCVIPPFGAIVSTPGLSFEGTFDDGQYQVRAFDNVDAGPGTIDTDRKITFRALGTVRGEKKLIELEGVEGVAGLRIINCQNDDVSAPCPDPTPQGNPEIINIPGRDPASTPGLPIWDQDFYRDKNNLPCSNVHPPINGNATLVGAAGKPGEIQIADDTCYFASGAVEIKQAGTQAWNNVVVFANQTLLVSSGARFSNSVLIALENIQLQGEIDLQSPPTQTAAYPVLISGGTITNGDSAINIVGNIFAQGSIGTALQPWNPGEVEGIIMGGDVYLKASNTSVTDGYEEGDVDTPLHYGFMPGFAYPPELLNNVVTGANSWEEIE